MAENDSATFELTGTLQVRDKAKRELDVRLMPWNVEIDTLGGREMFVRGAFEGTDPSRVLLMGMEHEVRMGLGQDGRPILTRRPVGRGMSLEERDDAAYMTVKVASVQEGDEILALADEGIVSGVSAEFREIPGGSTVEVRNGRRVKTHRRVQLSGMSTTYHPAYTDAAVLAVRSEEEPVSEEVTTTEAAPAEAKAPIVAVQTAAKQPDEVIDTRMDAAMTRVFERFSDRIAGLEERARRSFEIPAVPETRDLPTVGQWMEVALKILSGERIPDTQYRQVAEVVTTDNAGVVPPTYSSEIIGVIDASRPFMATTRRLPTPETGLSLIVPKITQRPTVEEQDAEKDELSSTKTIITTETFNMVTKGGVGDISLQLLKRADRSFLQLYLDLLAEAYAIECDVEALRALFDEIGGVGDAIALDPENLALGAAFEASFDAMRRAPDTIWLSTEAVAQFINAKATTTNQPLYSNIQSNINAAGGLQGTISGLRIVHVPALDTHGAFAVVGPSSGFAWAEDGTYTLQVDVPSKAGRDVALVGMVWFAPWYPAAFTAYNVAS